MRQSQRRFRVFAHFHRRRPEIQPCGRRIAQQGVQFRCDAVEFFGAYQAFHFQFTPRSGQFVGRRLLEKARQHGRVVLHQHQHNHLRVGVDFRVFRRHALQGLDGQTFVAAFAHVGKNIRHGRFGQMAVRHGRTVDGGAALFAKPRLSNAGLRQHQENPFLLLVIGIGQHGVQRSQCCFEIAGGQGEAELQTLLRGAGLRFDGLPFLVNLLGNAIGAQLNRQFHRAFGHFGRRCFVERVEIHLQGLPRRLLIGDFGQHQPEQGLCALGNAAATFDFGSAFRRVHRHLAGGVENGAGRLGCRLLLRCRSCVFAWRVRCGVQAACGKCEAGG